MARWMQAVALAAVVAVPPAFAQVSYSQDPSEPVPALPLEKELPGSDLALAEGELDRLTIVAAMAVGAAGGVAHQIRDPARFCAVFAGAVNEPIAEAAFQHVQDALGVH